MPQERPVRVSHHDGGAILSGHIAEVDLIAYALAPDAQSAARRAEISAHLAGCAACRQTCAFLTLSEEVLVAEARDPKTWEPAVGSPTMRSLGAWDDLAVEEDREAAELLKPYLENPISAAWQMLMTKRRLRTGGVVRALIRAAQAVREDDPLAALTFAEHAIGIAEGLDDERYPRSAAEQLAATAWKERANAQMFLGRLRDAHDSLDRAERLHHRYTPNELGLSIVALVRAGVFYVQGNLDEAMRLAERAEIGFMNVAEDKRRMDAVFLRASILFEAGRAIDAIPLFRQTIDHGEQLQNLDMIARGSYATGDCYVLLGNLGEASIHYHRALVIFRETGPALRLLETEWGIARVVLRGGKYDDAIRRLREVATHFERLEMVTQAALVGLDIIEALLALQKNRSIPAVAQHLFNVFTKAGMLTGALSAFAYLKEAATNGELLVDDLNEIRAFVRRAERQPNLQFVRPERPPEESV